MTAVTDTGFERTRLDERYTQLADAVKAIFGLDINIEPDTIDGQTLGIYAESISDLDQLAETVYHGFNPQSATGVSLSRLVELNGIKRIEGIPSTVMLKAIGSADTTIPAGSLVRSVGNVVFATDVPGVIDLTGEALIPATAVEDGPQLAATGTVTKIDTPIFGWQTVTNISDAVPGRFEETDEQLRIRRTASTSTPGQSILDSIYGGLANLPGVTQVKVLENYTNAVDANGLPPHSIYAIVLGGTDQNIVDMIWLKKTAGTTMFGAVSGIAVDSQGNPHTINFGRPIAVPIFITVAVTRKTGWPTDGAQRIKDELVAWALAEQSIGEEVIRTRLFDPINNVPGHSVTSLTIGTAASPTGTIDIPIAFDRLATFDTSRIVVNVT